ncbi:hypothetical protein EV714DRAFT_276941 [Schizophyllum commune]
MGTELDDAAITPWARPSDPNWHLHLPSAGIILHVVCIGIIEPCPDMFECTQYIERTPELRSIIACARREGNYEPVREAARDWLEDLERLGRRKRKRVARPAWLRPELDPYGPHMGHRGLHMAPHGSDQL